MTAFVVHFDHMDAILTHAIDNASQARLQTGEVVTITRDNASEIGRLLFLNNVLSCMNEHPGEDFRINMRSCEGYKFVPLKWKVTKVQAAKLIDCLEHQCSSCSHWFGSSAQIVLASMRPADIDCEADAYERAAWEYVRPRDRTVA